MQLVDTQRQVLKTLAQADPTANGYIVSGDDTALAAWFNAATAYVVWRTSAKRDELQGDGFDWTQVDNLTTGQARIWDWIFDSTNSLNPSSLGVRNGISECWKGTAAKVAVATYVLGLCKRTANRAESALASGSGTTASPSTLTATGTLTPADASLVRVA